MPFTMRCPAAKPTTTEYCNLSSTLGELDGASEPAFVLRGQLSGQCSEAPSSAVAPSTGGVPAVRGQTSVSLIERLFTSQHQEIQT